MKKSLMGLYLDLKRKYGPPKGQWFLWCKRKKSISEREEVIIGAVLTQRANWKNVEMALENLKKAKANSLMAIYILGKKNPSLLKNLVKPVGFYRRKTERLFALTKFIIDTYGGVKKMKRQKAEKLRRQLLAIKGVGEETADDILLYALDKPVFVIDNYTRRFVEYYQLSSCFSYSCLQSFFQKRIRKDFRLYQDFHALIVIWGKDKNNFQK